MNSFYKLLVYALIAATTNNFVWFALTYWVYLETRSVVSTGFVSGIYLVATTLSGFWFGALVDQHKKKNILLGSSIATLFLFMSGLIIFASNPESVFTFVVSPILWIFALILMCGVVAGNIIGITIPTLVTNLVPRDKHDKANGLFGTVLGVSFAITSVASGVSLAFGGMGFVLSAAIIFTILSILYLVFVPITEQKIIHIVTHTGQKANKIDIKGTIKIIQSIQGLFPLIFYATFNNFLGGVFMALMDAYGLSLVSVEVWGFLWGFLSLGFIIGGLIIAKKGLGKNPLRTLFAANMAIWIACIFFPVQASILLLFLGSLIWMILFPFIEAAEQTIIQKVVPTERMGRVFGFSQSIEQAASPLTSFLIGPITQFVFIPFMTTGSGVDLIGDWFGVGTGRGIALVFILAGIIGTLITLIAMRSSSYQALSERYLKH